ncbi:SpoIIE family protein phosphatase [Streptomyces olivaceoviridis]|uniref:SpoIIE family protein phosphatase n=1 Tax=Streptomyces olivaceoviridis TaxID=1921 RepID=UPI00370203E8
MTALDLHPAPPLGIGLTDTGDHPVDVVPFVSEDTLLLYTDGVIEARDRGGAFYPITDRVARWAGSDPEALLQQHGQRISGRTRTGSDQCWAGRERGRWWLADVCVCRT